ncbi:MAG: response regulator [Pirellulales bacterium]
MTERPGGLPPATSLSQAPRDLPAAETNDLPSTLQLCVGALCGVSGWPMGHVLVVDDQQRLGPIGPWHAADADDFRAWRDARQALSFAAGEGLCGRLWQSLAPEFSTDAADIGAAPAGLAPGSAFALPVKRGDELVAALEFFHPQKNAPVTVLADLADCVGTVLNQWTVSTRNAADRSEFAAIIEASEDAIIGIDAEGRIRIWNSGAERLYGYTRAEAVGESLRLIAPRGTDRFSPLLTRVLREARRLEQFETVRRRKNGQLVDVSLSAVPVLGSDGRVLGASSIERDISRRKRFEAECAKARADAEQANRAKSEFLANVSHELRTPMNAILGMLELSLEEKLPLVLRDYLATAHDSARVLLGLLNDLLDFSRAESGTFELEWSPFSLRRTLRQVTRTLAVRAQEKGLELTCRIHEDVPDHLEGDARRVQQVLMNLAGNAVKFTDSGEVAVEVSLQGQQPDWVELLLTVSDTGIGISRADQDRIFAPFTQVDSTSTRRHAGTGLGLTIAKELVKRMAGTLWVESELGRGSSFLCTLRLKRGLLDPAAQAALAPRAQLVGKGVLVIDDNVPNRRALEQSLLSWSLRPTLCESAADGLESLRQARPDEFPLVIIDGRQTVADGPALIEAARAAQVVPGAVVAVLPLDVDMALREHYRVLGVNCLEKPVSQLELLDALTLAIGRSENSAESPSLSTPAARALRVLVAEDTAANQKVVNAILSKRGHLVEIAENGLEAVDRIEKASFDVVLMDAQMPKMNGLQAAAAIRHISNADRARVPIIAMTAHALREDREKCLAAGMDEYLAKPVDANELIKVVEFYGSRNHPSRRPARAPRGQPMPSAKSATACVDLQAALERFGGNRSLLIQLIAIFRDEAEKLAAAVRTALDGHDLATAARCAHNLAGVALNLDAGPLVESSRALEEVCDAGTIDAARAAFELVEAEVARVRAALENPTLPS